MNIEIWIAIYLPVFILLFVILPHQRRIILNKIRKKRGNKFIVNELIKKYIGKNCIVSTGSFGGTVRGHISAVEDNWIEINTKKGFQLINAEFITNISEVPAKKLKST